MPIAIKIRNVWIVARRACADGDLFLGSIRTSEIDLSVYPLYELTYRISLEAPVASEA